MNDCILVFIDVLFSLNSIVLYLYLKLIQRVECEKYKCMYNVIQCKYNAFDMGCMGI